MPRCVPALVAQARRVGFLLLAWCVVQSVISCSSALADSQQPAGADQTFRGFIYQENPTVGATLKQISTPDAPAQVQDYAGKIASAIHAVKSVSVFKVEYVNGCDNWFFYVESKSGSQEVVIYNHGHGSDPF